MSDILDFLLYGLLKTILFVWFCGVVIGVMVFWLMWAESLINVPGSLPVIYCVILSIVYLLFSSAFFAVWRWKGEDLF